MYIPKKYLAIGMALMFVAATLFILDYMKGPVFIHITNNSEFPLTDVVVSEERSGNKTMVNKLVSGETVIVTMTSASEQDYRVIANIETKKLESYPIYTEGRECISFEFYESEVKGSFREAEGNC